jgi:C4-dicarboxylate transporter DctQ subunit
MKLVTKANAVFDRVLDSTNILASILLVFIMLSVCIEVVSRYFFGSPTVWVVEISEMSLLYLTFLAAAFVLKRQAHVKIDLLLNRLNPRIQAMLGIVISIIGAICFLFIVWYGAQVTWDNFLRGTYRSTVLEVPNAAVLFIIPLGSLLLVIQFLRDACGHITSWRKLESKEQRLEIRN